MGRNTHAAIGNGRSAALVSNVGSIEWLCWPRFDSPSFLAAMLDAEKGGHWRISPRAPFRASRSYAEDSNVLVTTFETPGGDVTLTDLMPVFSEDEKHFLTVFVVARGVTGTPRNLEPTKCEGWAWFGWDELPQPLFRPLQTLVTIGWRPGGA